MNERTNYSEVICGLFVVNEKFTRSYIISGATLGGAIITEIVAGEDGFYIRGTQKEDYEKKNESLVAFIPFDCNPIVEYYPRN